MIRQPLVNRTARGQQSSATVSSPAPIGGWNARDPEASMPPTEALWLENWWPSTADVTVRNGAQNHVTGLGAKVMTLMGYASPTQKRLFAATNTGIYDASAGGTAGTPMKSVTSGKFQYATMTVLGATSLMAVNGVDKLQMFNGTSWQSIDTTTTPSITGIATTEFSNIAIFKRRVWFVQKHSMSAWYLPVNQIGGAAVEFPVGQLFRYGGELVAMTSWTLDGGNGSDDYLVFVTSEGELAVYKGTDPTSGSSDFALVGVYFVGEPVGPKCCIKYGGDVLILTQVGLFPLSKMVQSTTVNRAQAVSNKIDLIFSQAASVYGTNYGWEGVVFPKENMLLVNVPTTEGYSSNQLCMNTITGAWCLFTGWNAFCWEVWDQKLYFGGDGFVAQAMVGYEDFGANITAYAKGAFNYFGSRGRNKHFKLFRPIIKVDGDISIDIGMDVDFQDVDTFGSIVFADTISSKWDAATWDTATWSGDYTAQRDWRTVANKEGFCAALRLRVATKGIRVGWSSTDFVYQRGGVL